MKWNGERADFFKPHRGICQGDPISPYLFVICMDKLSHMIMEAIDSGSRKAPKAGKMALKFLISCSPMTFFMIMGEALCDGYSQHFLFTLCPAG